MANRELGVEATAFAKGDVGNVYATEFGQNLAEERETNEGWKQRSPEHRVKVHYKRFSHSACFWVEET